MRVDRPTNSGASNDLLRTQGMGADPMDMHSDAWVVWGSIFLVFLLSLLPWRLLEFTPDLLLLVVTFWVVHEARRVGLVTGFVMGLFMDVHDAGPLGLNALSYMIACYGAVVLHRRLLRFDLWHQALHMLPVFLVAGLVKVAISLVLTGLWPGWSWLIGIGLITVLWVPIGWILLIPGNRLAGLNSQSD
jgi:rod shape-determining protein MreD